GTIVGRPCGLSGFGLKSADGRNSLCVLRSSAIVFAPVLVLIVSTAVYLSGPSWWKTDTVPSPQEENTSPVSGSKAAASTRSPIGSLATTLPLSALTTTISLLRQPTNRRWVLVSIARPVGVAPGASGQVSSTVIFLASSLSSVFLSSRLTKTWPAPSAAANSG